MLKKKGWSYYCLLVAVGASATRTGPEKKVVLWFMFIVDFWVMSLCSGSREDEIVFNYTLHLGN